MLALRAPAGTVASEKLRFKGFRYVEARVLQERDEVVGKGPAERVLEVQKADPLHPLAAG
jgi:hypothetical protein